MTTRSDISPIVRTDALCKSISGKRILDDVTFSVRRGEIVGILGPNGAGKSTLIAILSGLLLPDKGKVEIFGRGIRKDIGKILQRINICSPYASLPPQLTVEQNLSFYAHIYGVAQPADQISRLLASVGMTSHAKTRFGKLSSGQAVRICLCKALLNEPELLLLDEPTAYLDPDIASRIRTLLLQERTARGMTVLLTSHNLAEIEALCDRVVLLAHGQVIAQGTTREVTRSVLGRGSDQASLADTFASLARR